MQLPNAERAIIPAEKLRDCLLNPEHPQNGGKWKPFAAMGYDFGNWEVLASDLRVQHLAMEAFASGNSSTGQKYYIIAPLIGPLGSAIIKSIWQIDYGAEVPRFLTAYPRR